MAAPPSPDQPPAEGQWFRKVPEITLYFWVIKVLCTTVGETITDQLNGTPLGAPAAFGLSGTAFLMGDLLAIALLFQFVIRRYVPAVYWLPVVLISVVGTIITDHLHDDLGVGLDVLTAAFAFALVVAFAAWYTSEKTLSIHSVYTPRREAFYWAAVLATFALGTAAGDFLLEGFGVALGQGPAPDDPTQLVPLYPQVALLLSAAVFGAVIVFAFAGRRYLKLNEVAMFWLAYVFTRPFGANLGDILTLAPDEGGLGIDQATVNVLFLAAIVGSIWHLTRTGADVFEKNRPSPLRLDDLLPPGRRRKLVAGATVVLLLALLVPFQAAGTAEGPDAGALAFDVTFSTQDDAASPSTGTIAYLSTKTLDFSTNDTNLTEFKAVLTWSDSSLSPATNPTVSITVTPPASVDGNGSAPVTVSVPPSGGQVVVDLNVAPENGTVNASSPDDAIGQAAGDSNATAGTGDWKVQIQVGAALGGRIRPRGAVSFDLQVDFLYFVGDAQLAPAE